MKNIDGFVKSPISALRAIPEEYHVHLSTLNSSKIAQALILDVFQSRMAPTFYKSINIFLTGFFFMLIAADANAAGSRFVDAVFANTGAVCATEECHMYGMPVGDGIKTGITSNRFELIKLKIHIICAGTGNVRQAGSWQRLWSPVHGAAMAAPFKAGGDMVLIMHFPETGVILARTVPTGKPPEEDWTKPDAPRKRNTNSMIIRPFRAWGQGWLIF